MTDNLAGRLLISMPNMDDGYFDHSVILLCAHSSEHAMGIVLNKALSTPRLGVLFDHLDIEITSDLADQAVLCGGPVAHAQGFVLHSEDFFMEHATLRIQPDIYLSANKGILDAMASDQPPADTVFALGYAGWGPMQLDNEISSNMWLIGEPDRELVFGNTHETKWQYALNKIGVRPGQLQIEAGRA